MRPWHPSTCQVSEWLGYSSSCFLEPSSSIYSVLRAKTPPCGTYSSAHNWKVGQFTDLFSRAHEGKWQLSAGNFSGCWKLVACTAQLRVRVVYVLVCGCLAILSKSCLTTSLLWPPEPLRCVPMGWHSIQAAQDKFFSSHQFQNYCSTCPIRLHSHRFFLHTSVSFPNTYGDGTA